MGITISETVNYRDNTLVSSKVIGFETNGHRTMRYTFTIDDTDGANTMTISANMTKGSVYSDDLGRECSAYAKVSTSATACFANSEENAGWGGAKIGGVSSGTVAVSNTFNCGNLLPGTTYYLFVYPGTSKYQWAYWQDAQISVGGSVTYTITYNKGTNGTGTNTTDSKTHGTAKTLKGAIFTRTGYTQTGWSTTDGGSKTYDLSASYTSNAAITLYPVWTANSYTCTINPNGGTYKNSSGANATANDSYTFRGNHRYVPISSTSTTAGVTSPSTDTGIAARYYISLPTKKGYSFSSWTTSPSKTVQAFAFGAGAMYSITENPQTNITATANWTANTYTIQYNSNGGSGSMDSHTVTYDTTVTIKNNAFTAPTGYSFAGWTTNSNGTNDNYGWFNSSTLNGWSGTWTYINGEYGVANGKLILYAMWKKNSYSYTLGAATGVNTAGSTASGSKEYQSTITLKATPSTGYTWSTWKSSNAALQSDLTTANTTFSMPAGALTMTPVVTANGYTIVFNGNGNTGGSMNNMTCSYGTSYNLTTNGYTKTGYEFLGWSTDSSATTATYTNGQSISNLTSTNGGTVTLYAIWEAKSQTFIWAYDSNQKKYRWHRALKYVFTPDTVQNKSTPTT